MDERFAEKMKERRRRRDAELIGRFTEWYCHTHHAEDEMSPLSTDGVELGIYGKKLPVLCSDCAEFVAYSEKRTAFCAQDPKPFCAFCSIKCYKPDMKERSREIMRWAGPRSIFSRYCLRALAHMWRSRKRG